MRSSNLLCPRGIIYTSLRDVFLLYYLKCSEKDIKMSTAMNLMKAFLAMNLISKFVSLVNSHFFTLKLVLLCYYKCSSKQCNHVYFVVLCTSKFSGSLKSFILIILIIYLFSFFFFFEKLVIYIFLVWVLFSFFFILFFFLKMRTFKAYSQQLSNIQYSIINCSHHGCLYLLISSPFSPECFLHLCQPPVCSLNL